MALTSLFAKLLLLFPNSPFIFPTPFPTTPLIFSQMEREGRATDGKTWKTPFLLIIFAPGVEKTGWKFQAAGG